VTIYLVQIRYIWCTNTRYSVFDTPKSYLRLLFCYLFFRSRARSTSALPTKAAPPLPFAVGAPAKLFSFRLKTGSNLGVKSHHKGFILHSDLK